MPIIEWRDAFSEGPCNDSLAAKNYPFFDLYLILIYDSRETTLKGKVEAMKEEAKKLIEMVKKEIPDKEIMRELGIQTKTSLKKMYFDALIEAGKIKGILTERELKKAQAKPRELTIGKRGTILLSKPLLIDRLGFKEGDKFTVARRKDSVILRKKEK
jgi:hypothetical protein